jgi:CheY-like chemotaxis protein
VDTDLTGGLRFRPDEKPHEVTREPQSGLRTLVVAGKLGLAEDMAALLRHWGHHVRVAMNGPAALQIAEMDPADVVLLEGNLPGASPWEVARHLLGQPAAKRPFLIVLAEHILEMERHRLGETGVDLVLVKPVDLDLLKGVLCRFYRIIMPVESVPG